MTSSRRQRRRSRAARLLEACFHASFGGFLLWLVTVVVRAPASLLGMVLVGRLAFALTVGTVGVGWLALALITLTGADERPPLPRALAELCPACGNHVPASHRDCSRCGLDATQTRRWQATRPGGASEILSATASLCLLGLGLFLAIEPSLHGRSLAVCLLLAATGAVLLAVGVCGLRTSVHGQLQVRRERGRYQATMPPKASPEFTYIEATAQLDPDGNLVHAGGSSTWRTADEGLSRHDALSGRRSFRWARRCPLAAGVDYRHEPREDVWRCDETFQREGSEKAERRDSLEVPLS